MAQIQHQLASQALAIITDFGQYPELTYKSLASNIGRNSETDSRAMAQVCDLLDAAATYAGVPLLALVRVKNAAGDLNPRAWVKGTEPGLRDRVIANSLAHAFTQADFDAIGDALNSLAPLGNTKAWKEVVESMDSDERIRRLTSSARPDSVALDTIQDIGADIADALPAGGLRYRRDDQVRAAVLHRAQGRCEYCGQHGFITEKGDRYLEAHHVIALSSEGADRLWNVVALCPSHHREAHYGIGKESIERELLKKLAALFPDRFSALGREAAT